MRFKKNTIDGEPILFDLRPSWISIFYPSDILGFYRAESYYLSFPWRASCLAACIIIAVELLIDFTNGELWYLLIPAIVLSIFMILSEVIKRRQVITATRYIRTYGILGSRRLEMPLKDVRWVEVKEPRFPGPWQLGSIIIRGQNKRAYISGIAHAREIAQQIEKMVEEARNKASTVKDEKEHCCPK